MPIKVSGKSMPKTEGLTRALNANGAGKARRLRNLRHRLPAPARGNGRVERAAKRVLDLFGEASTADVAAFSHAERILLHGQRLGSNHYETIRDAIRRTGAIPVGRGGGMGRPIRWRLKPPV